MEGKLPTEEQPSIKVECSHKEKADAVLASY